MRIKSAREFKRVVHNELEIMIAYQMNRMLRDKVEKRFGHVNFTVADGKKYKRHIEGLIKVLHRVIVRG